MRRLRLRHVLLAALAVVALLCLAVVAFDDPDSDDTNVLDAAVREAVEAGRDDESPSDAAARLFRVYERRFDRVDYGRLVEAGEDLIDSGSVGPEYVEAADEDGDTTAAFVGFTAIVNEAAARPPR